MKNQKRIDALERIRVRVDRMYGDALKQKHGTARYKTRKRTMLAGELGALDWAIDLAKRVQR
jgi:hypothetical protein